MVIHAHALRAAADAHDGDESEAAEFFHRVNGRTKLDLAVGIHVDNVQDGIRAAEVERRGVDQVFYQGIRQTQIDRQVRRNHAVVKHGNADGAGSGVAVVPVQNVR